MDILGMPAEKLLLRDSNIGHVTLRPGGVGRNIAEQLVRLGCKCTLLTAFGTDSLADALCASCARLGIDISHALTAQGNTCVYLCLHDETGDMLAAINDILAQAREDGTLAALSEKYFGVDLTKPM